MVILAAMNYTNTSISKYFMIDAAVAIEALDSTAAQSTNMIHPDWNRPTNSYASRLYASEWYNLFATNDYRSGLTWRDRLANFGNTDVYNFYSSGEEVLREHPGYPPDDLAQTIAYEAYYLSHLPVGVFTWAMQEKTKGRAASDALLGSTHGGWKMNSRVYGHSGPGVTIPYSAAEAAALTDSQLRTNAFFDVTSASFGWSDTNLFIASGSPYAQTNRNRILSDAIPALTLPVGANAVTNLDQLGVTYNFDMQALYENGWALQRGPVLVGAAARGEWHHSDLREMAYTYTHPLFDKFVILGDLK